MSFKLNPLKALTLFLPLLSLGGAILLVILFLFSPQVRVLKPRLSNGLFVEGEPVAYFNSKEISAPEEPFLETEFVRLARVLSATDPKAEKRIEVDLSKQRLYAFQGGSLVYNFLISSGKWGRTPTGDFRIWSKLKYTLMHGGSQANNTYYYLPNVPFTQYFHHGFGIHGTYWHNNFGHPMSHGCINMYTPDAQTLFNWTDPVLPEDEWIIYPNQENPGTRVLVYGNAPQE